MRVFSACLLVLLLLSALWATNATAVYRSNTGSCGINCPKYKVWNNLSKSWGAETEFGATTGAAITQARIYFSPLNQKRMVVTQNLNMELDLYVSWNGIEWYQTRNLTKLAGQAPTAYRGFDAGFESATNDAVLVFAVNSSDTACDLAYVIIPAGATTNSSSYACIDDSGHGTDLQYGWVQVDADPVASSNEMIAVGYDFTSTDSSAWVWDGSAWGNQQELSTGNNYKYEAIAAKYSADGTDGFALAATGVTGAVNGYYWNGGSWTAANPGDMMSSNQDVCYMTLKADPATDDLMLAVNTGATCTAVGLMAAAYWSGSAWTLNQSIDTTGAETYQTRAFDFSWTPAGSNGSFIFDTDTAGNTLTNKTGRGVTAWLAGPTSTISTYTGTGAWIQMARNPSTTEPTSILGLRLNSAFGIGAFNYSNATRTFSNYGNTSISTDTTVITFEAMGLAFLLAADNTPPSVSGTAVNATSVGVDGTICVNASVADQNGAPVEVWAQVWLPGAVNAVNLTLSDTGCNAGVAGDNYYGVDINVGPIEGTLKVNTTFANDSFSNAGQQTPWPDLNVSVVSLFVDTSISTSLLTFGPIDPGSAGNPAIENPVVLVNTINSNTAVDVYLNNSNMTYASYWINATNLSVWTSNAPASATPFKGWEYLNGQIPNTGFYENLGVGLSTSLYFWHDVPAGQAQGDYTSSVRVHSVADGQVP